MISKDKCCGCEACVQICAKHAITMEQEKDGFFYPVINKDKCVECGQPAVAFWPLIDPDIPTYPYCRKCLDKAKIELLIKAFGKSKNEAKAIVKMSAKTN